MNNYTIIANLDVANKGLNTIVPYGIFQGTKNLNLQLSVKNDGSLITSFVPTIVTPYLVVYDRLDGLSTAYQLEDNKGITIVTSNGIVLVVNSNELSDMVKYPNKCGLIFNMKDNSGNSIITTEFEYNVIPNNAYDFIYGLN